VIFKQSDFKILMVIFTARKLWQESNRSRSRLILAIRSHNRSRSHLLKHRSGVGVEKIKLRTPLAYTAEVCRIRSTGVDSGRSHDIREWQKRKNPNQGRRQPGLKKKFAPPLTKSGQDFTYLQKKFALPPPWRSQNQL